MDNLSLFKLIDGSVMYLDGAEEWIGSDISIKQQYDPINTAFVRKNLNLGDVFVDVGAHVGYFTILASKIVGNNGKVFAFEPCSRNYSVLLKNIEANNLTNVIAVNKAVSNVNGVADFYNYDPRHWALSSLCPERNKPVQASSLTLFGSSRVETIRLDKYFDSQKILPDMIKIDVEGAEPEVLDGLGSFLGEIPMMMLEDVVGDAIAKCKDCGYKISGGCNQYNYILVK